MNLLKYSNGVGHLIMSCFVLTGGLVCLLWPTGDATVKGLGVGMILTVQSAWFIPGSAKQVAQSVTEALPMIEEKKS